jgi:hypothetical protein
MDVVWIDINLVLLEAGLGYVSFLAKEGKTWKT